MNQARKATEELILKHIKSITRSDTNSERYANYVFKNMTDEDFDKFISDLENNRVTLSIVIPTDEEKLISVENNFKIAKELGVSFYQQLRVGATDDIPEYVTPNEALVIKLPIRRAAQTVAKKASIPDDSSKIDMLTGQVTGASRSAKLTLPEIQILNGYGCKDSTIELMKTRGGDLGELNAFVNLAYRNGDVSQSILRNYQTGVVSTKTVKSFFLAAHIKSNPQKQQ